MTINFLPRRPFPFPLLACFLLSACSLSSRLEQVPLARFDLGPPPSATAASEKNIPLAIEVRLPSWLDSTAMNYRLLYENPRRMHEYAFSRWAAPPSQLLTQALQTRLGEIPPASSSSCLLRIEVDEFAQFFHEPATSVGLIDARIVLFDKKRQPLARTHYHGEYPAASPDAQGGVAALGEAAADLAEKTLGWRDELKAKALMNACLP
ncbi:MAG: PqiC family protein [Betaproteobacteria bacterium]|nr:PqiC family protein [Betaproteobacteria bacterium]